jgi:fructokinase
MEALGMYALGFDIGGTKSEAAVLEFAHLDAGLGNATDKRTSRESFLYQNAAGRWLKGVVKARARVETQRQKGYENFLQTLAELGRSVSQTAGLPLLSVNGVGLAIPGSVDPRTHTMLNGNLLMLKGRAFLADLKQALQLPHVPFSAENDANCFVLAETLCGSGLEHAKKAGLNARDLTAVGLTLGTGLGGGIVMRGQTLAGRRGGGGELGHVVLHTGGAMCWCGQRGCAEQYLAGTALEQRFNGRLYSQVSTAQKGTAIFELAQNQDPVALAVVKEFRANLALYLGQLCTLFDPDFFVLGGGVSLQPALYENLAPEMARQTFLPETDTPIYRNVLGDSAGVVGAALLSVKDL